MDDLDLVALLNDLKSDRVERKASINDPDRICEAICAFANDLPNHRLARVLFIGINYDGSYAKLSVTDKLLLTLSELRSNGNILPFPIQRTIEQQLTSMRFATVGPQPIPTVLSIVVVGKDPLQFLAGAYIQFLRLDGTELIDPIKDQKEIDGPLPDTLRMIDETFQAHISVASDITAQPVEIQSPDYPIVALQQLTRNAILHRTYEGTNAPVRVTWFSDRIEIRNPGGPFGQVNRENFGTPGITDYRNPHIAEAMKNLGHIQRFGVGISLARRELEKNSNPPPEFIVEEAYIVVILRRRL